MRAREVQISQLACAIFNQHIDIDECITLARNYILEAERRAEQRVRAEIGRDSERLDFLGSGCCDVRFRAEPIADTGDADTYCDIIEHYMADPKERVIGSADTIRAAIDAAREVG
ncbi:hypothetical protein ACJRO0_04850 [Acetobacter oryzifermentans]|uniref:hypothetical protein n=1 Tax=Acetobacter oryzifermentans TaxID=1633874 RepID=UPI0039BF35EB